MEDQAKSYRQAAYDVFRDLLDPGGSYLTSTSFWQNGCVADTLIDYLLMAINDPDLNNPITIKIAQGYIKTIHDHYYATLPNDAGCWYDDFGWWGITGAKAYDKTYETLFGPYLNEFKKIALDNWAKMQNGKNNHRNYGAPFVWDHCDQRIFAGVRPKYPGGVWQYDIFACKVPGDCSPNNPATPIKVECPDGTVNDAVDLGPYQLSVVNGLYLVLATRLAKAGVIATGFANDEYSFINSWCNTETGAGSSLLNRYGSADYGLIRERVGYYADGSKSAFYHEGQNAWAGDQGLFMGGLLDYAIASRTPAALDLAIKIIKGVVQQMQQAPTYDGQQIILAGYIPYENALSPFTNDPGDYQSGLGVLMRYLYYCYRNDSQVRQIMNGSNYRTAISKAANAARDNNIIPAAVPMFTDFNRLATLMMGIALGMSFEEETVTGAAVKSAEDAG